MSSNTVRLHAVMLAVIVGLQCLLNFYIDRIFREKGPVLATFIDPRQVHRLSDVA